MSHISEKVLVTIDIIQKRPKMFMVNPDFRTMENFLVGYFHGLSDITEIPYNRIISDWLREKHKMGSPLIWTQYIFYVLSDRDERKAYKLLFDVLKEYFQEVNPYGTTNDQPLNLNG